MPITVGHVLSATTPDDPTYEIKPSNWNSNHAVTLNISGTDIFGALSNSNNITFGLAPNGAITASASYSSPTFNQSIQTQGSVQINGSTGSIVFANSNGISFGGNGSTITASYNSGAGGAAISALGSSQNSGTVVFANSNGVSFGMTGSTITAQVTASVSAGVAAIQLPNNTFTSGTITWINSNGISFGSSGVNGVTASYTVPSTTNFAGTGFSTQSTTGSFLLGTHNTTGLTLGVPAWLTTFTNGAGTGFTGTNATGTLNSNGLALSVGVGSAAGTAGIFGISNTTGQSTSSTYNLSSLPIAGGGIISIGQSAGTLQISAPAAAVLSQMSMGISGGNTSGNSGTVAQGRVVFAGGNNVTLSGSTNGSNMTITVSAGSQAAAPVNFSAGTTSGNLGSVVFSNSNGVSFGLSGSTITGSANAGGGIYAGVSNLGNFAGSTGTVSTGNLVLAGYGAVTLSQSTGAAGSAATVSISAPATSSLVAGNANVTISSNGSTISIYAASAAAAPINFSAGTTSSNLGSVVFSNSNGISFGLNGSTITGSLATTYAGTGFTTTTTGGTVLVGTHNTAGLSLGVPAWITTAAGGGVAISAAGSSQNVGTVVFSNANGVTFGMNGSTVTASALGGGGGGVGISASGSSQSAGAIVFSNSNNVSFGMNGSTVTATATIATAGFAGTGFTTTTAGGSVILGTHNTAGLLLGVPPYLTTSNSVANFSAGVSFLGNNAGSTGITGSQLVLVGSGPVSLSQSTGANGATVSILGPATSSIVGAGVVSVSVNGSTISISAGAQTNQPVALSGSNGSYLFSTATFGNSNSISFYTTNGSMVASGNFAGTGFSSNTTSGLLNGTLNSAGLSVAVPYRSRYMWPRDPNAFNQQTANFATNSASFVYVPVEVPVTGSRLDALAYWSGSTNTSNGFTMSGNIAMSFWGAIYSRNGSTLSSMSSGSTQTSYVYAGNAGASWISQGVVRPMSIPMNFNIPPGEYFVGFNMNSSYISTNTAANYSALPQTIQFLGGISGVFTGAQYAEIGSLSASSSNLPYGMGVATATSNGVPASIALSNIAQTGPAVQSANLAFVFRNA